MPVFEIGLDDGRKLHIDADSQEAALAGAQHFQDQEKPPAPSGVIAGAEHGAVGLVNSDRTTAKDFLGIGDAPAPQKDDYVPANVTNGSMNPLKWNYGQVPQKIAEQAPGLGQDIAAASIASKVMPGGMKAKALAGLVGGGLSMFGRTAGDTAKEVAVNRTGDENAEPNAADLTKGGLTAAGSAAVGAINPLRYIPGANKLTSVGAGGALDAFKKYLTTTAVGAGSSAASDAVTQLGTTGTIDPSRSIEAAAGGGLTGAAMAAPRAVADTARAVTLRKFGGDNLEASKNYAQRLQDAGFELGNSSNDFTAHSNVKTDLKNELRDTAANVRKQITPSPEADNALQRAQSGQPLSSDDIDLIQRETAAAPDGANAAHLARTMRVAQMAEDLGSYDTSDGGKWAGGLSGIADKYAVRPFKAHALIGGAASLYGAHMMGSYGLPVLAGAAGTYAGARAFDAMAGTRSPAKAFAQTFADRSAQLRMASTPPTPPPAAPVPGSAQPWGPTPQNTSGPTGPQVPPPAAPSAPMPPWGPRPPMAGPTGPQVAAPAAPQPAPAAPPAPPAISPLAMSMLKQKLKQGLPPDPVVPPPAPVQPPAPPAISPLALSMLKQKLKQGLPEPVAPPPAPPVAPPAAPPPISPMALTMLKQRLKQGLPTEAPPVAQVPPVEAAPAAAPASTEVPTDVARNAKLLMSGMAKVAKMKATATAEPTPSKITKQNGKVESTAPPAPAPFEPYSEEHLYPKDITSKEYAAREFARYGARSPKYLAKAENSAQARIDAANTVTAKHPEYHHAISGLLRQLHVIGRNHAEASQAVAHYANLIADPNVGASMREAFK